MRRLNYVYYSFMVGVLFFSNGLMAQLELPRVSPKAELSQTVGITEIEITYCRPGVKDRVIWGELVPFNEIWRTGANEATTISFSTDVTVHGKNCPKGTYSLFTVPEEEAWTIILNKNASLWGTYEYDQSEDALRIEVKPQAADFRERMMFYFENLQDNSADVVLHWEKLKIPFTVKVETDRLVMETAQETIDWQPSYQAARYALENSLDLQKAQNWLKASMAIDKNYWNTAVHARLLYKMGKETEAIPVLEEALQMGRSMEREPFNYAQMEALLTEWKK